MRKIFTFLCAALMSVGMWAVTPQDGDTWDETTKTLTVNSNPGNEAYNDQSDIQHVVISSSVTQIGDYAFGGCYYLETVIASEGLETIAEGAFSSCEHLESVTLPSTLQIVDQHAFAGSSNLKSVTITAPALNDDYGYGVYAFEDTHADLKIYVPAESVETYKTKWSDYADKIVAIGSDEPTTYTLQLVADPEKGSVEVTNLLGSGIVDNGNGNYTVPENAEVTILATPLEGYEFSGWKVGNVSCDFLDCGTAVNTNDNPMTITMTADAAYLAEFAAVAPQPAEPIEVIITNSDFPESGNTCTKDGVTLTAGQGLDPTMGEINGGGTFTTTLGNFTKIEITTGSGDLNGVSGEGWTSKMSKATWAGTPASSVSFSGDALGDEYLSITCTIAPKSTPSAISNTVVSDKATKRIVNGQLLIEKNGKLYNITGARVK